MRKIIARLKELHEKASPPNWFVQEGWTLNDERFCHIDGWTDEATHGEWLALKRADADLIAEVRNALPDLLRYVKDLETKAHPPQGVVVPIEVAQRAASELLALANSDGVGITWRAELRALVATLKETKAHPPQGVVVPVEVIKQAIKILDTHIAYTINALGWGAVPVVRDTRIALADAIKEGDTP